MKGFKKRVIVYSFSLKWLVLAPSGALTENAADRDTLFNVFEMCAVFLNA